MNHEPSYSLCEELKKAGFPQEPTSGGDFFWTPYGWVFEEKMPKKWKDIWLRKPTLEQLIEACGEDLDRLKRGNDPSEEWNWYAFNGTLTVEGYGSTPIIAVARLWLALNSKAA